MFLEACGKTPQSEFIALSGFVKALELEILAAENMPISGGASILELWHHPSTSLSKHSDFMPYDFALA